MRIVVNHLTRMQSGYICVAGIDVQQNIHLRPVLSGQRLSTQLLRMYGGPFDLAHEVDLGPTRSVGTPPETEDVEFTPGRAQGVGRLTKKDFWQLLKDMAKPSLSALFGTALKRDGTHCIVAPGTGAYSLGCLEPTSPCELYVNNFDKLRLRLLHDDGNELDLSVTDLKFYKPNNWDLRKDVIRVAANRLRDEISAILSVGLTREWKGHHWLQVNNLHFEVD